MAMVKAVKDNVNMFEIDYAPSFVVGPHGSTVEFEIRAKNETVELALETKEIADLALFTRLSAACDPDKFGFALTVSLERNNQWRVSLNSQLLRYNFATAADAYAWAEKTDVFNLRVFHYLSEVDDDVKQLTFKSTASKFILAEDAEDAFVGASQHGEIGPIRMQEWKNKKWNWTTVPTSLWSVVDTKRFRGEQCLIRFYGRTESDCVEFLSHYHEQDRVLAGDFHIDGPNPDA